MGMNYYKVTYDCDCGYGSCGRQNLFILELCRSTDIYRIYHKQHVDEPNSELVEILCCGDNAIEALSQLLNNTNVEDCSDADRNEIKQIALKNIRNII